MKTLDFSLCVHQFSFWHWNFPPNSLCRLYPFGNNCFHIFQSLCRRFFIINFISARMRKRQIMRQSLNSTPPVMGGAASGIRPEDYLTMA